LPTAENPEQALNIFHHSSPESGKMKLNMSKNNHTMGRALSLVLTELLPSS
jgi:hypothetical protein